MNTYLVVNTTDCEQIYMKSFTCKKEDLFENILCDKDLRESILCSLFDDYLTNRKEYEGKYCDGNRYELVNLMGKLFGNDSNKYWYIILNKSDIENGTYIWHV